jgi:hypothetical protein
MSVYGVKVGSKVQKFVRQGKYEGKPAGVVEVTEVLPTIVKTSDKLSWHRWDGRLYSVNSVDQVAKKLHNTLSLTIQTVEPAQEAE